MARTFTLVDFENIQPTSLAALSGDDSGLLVFVGANQTKVPIDLAVSMQPLGSRAVYVKIAGTGRNALDFHLAFHLGKLSAEHPGADFTIVSRDAGFDPLVTYIQGLGHACRRVEEVRQPALPVAPSSNKQVAIQDGKALPTTAPDRARYVAEKLKSSTKPRTVDRLNSMVSTWFRKSLTQKELDAVLKALVSSKKITVDGQKVAYHL